MTRVVLSSRQLARARRRLRALAAGLDAQRNAVRRASPVDLPSLEESALGRTAALLAAQDAELRTVQDLAVLLEAGGEQASYEGTGTIADVERHLGPAIGDLLGSLHAGDPGDLRTLADLAGIMQRHSENPLVGDALVDAVGTTGLLDAFTGLVPSGPAPDASPEQVHDWWLALTPAQQLAATLVQSRTYGNLDGIPASARDLANRKNIPEYRRELLALLEDPDSYDPGGDPGLYDHLFVAEDVATAEKLRALDALETVLDRGGRQLLLLDPFDGDQLHAAVAIGDVDTADHVAVFTPGFTSTVQDSLERYDDDMMNLNVLAAQQSERLGDGGTVATVAWLGYDAPQLHEVLDWPRSVALPDLARTGGEDLATFYAGVNASREPDPHLTALGHSYGSLTTGYALQRDGTGVDDAVLFGSPGPGTWARDDLHVPDGHLFVAEAEDDPVADLGGTAPFGVDPSHLEGVDFLSTHESDLPGGGRGKESTGHSEYLRAESTAQYNLAVTVVGLADERLVTIDAPPLFRDGRPTGDFYSSLPVGARDAYETGRGLVEHGIDRLEDVDLPDLPDLPDIDPPDVRLPSIRVDW